MNPRLYLETTIPSYLVARPSQNLRLAADQQATREWWDTQRHNYDLYTSAAVRAEAERGDAGSHQSDWRFCKTSRRWLKPSPLMRSPVKSSPPD